MVPSLTSSLLQVEEDEESSSDDRNLAHDNSRAEVPTDVMNRELLREPFHRELGQHLGCTVMCTKCNI
ncbi:putative cryptochrome [Helianthus annuus]|nr:putative cryptochrome [Helianthus annuus]KAJ0460660.1 putative cryptochrome [Helianthus annuus]